MQNKCKVKFIRKEALERVDFYTEAGLKLFDTAPPNAYGPYDDLEMFIHDTVKVHIEYENLAYTLLHTLIPEPRGYIYEDQTGDLVAYVGEIDYDKEVPNNTELYHIFRDWYIDICEHPPEEYFWYNFNKMNFCSNS